MTWFASIRKRKIPGAQPVLAMINEAPKKEPAPVITQEINIPPGDPLLAYILNNSGVIDVEHLQLDSPTLKALKDARVRLSVPLISQGELIGLLNLGRRLSEADYTIDDRRLLNNLSTQAAPALRVAQLARQQQIEALQRERMEQEMRVARVIQQTLLPKHVPYIPGWSMAAHWQPARAVSGDFYDFMTFPDGRLAIFTGDVTDKGVPAALVMATTRSILRTAAENLVMPGLVLAEANNRLCPDIPPNMFVTCLYALLDPVSGEVIYANAGHNPPFQRTQDGITEIRVRGMPLGLMPDMPYEEKVVVIAPGEDVILYSDGLIEAHNPQGDIFGFPRLRQLLSMPQCGEAMIQCMLNELVDFTGAGWEQEDDVTFVSLERLPVEVEPGRRTLAHFSLPSHPGNERQAMEQVVAAVSELNLPPARLERLKTAVAEATMNAMEHGNHYDAELPVEIEVVLASGDLIVTIRDRGVGQEAIVSEDPNLDAKLAGLQSPRGWGLFLIKNMVDEMNVSSDDKHHTMELVLHL